MTTESASLQTVQNLETIELDDTQQLSKKGSRSFKVKLEQNGPQYGRYNGDSPYQAANKALSEIIRTRVKNSLPVDENINFFLVESTKGSGKKVHQYVGHRMKLDNPVSYQVNDGQTITKEYKNVLRKVKKTEMVGGAQQLSAPVETTTNTQSETVVVV
jgi:hypothetical protein